MKKVNLRKALEAAATEYQQDHLMLLVHDWLYQETLRDEVLQHALQNGNQTGDLLPAKQLNRQLCFDLESIQQVSIRYRLRFLESHRFAGDIPREALTKIKALEQKTDTSLKQFYILAPAKAFKLGDCNEDPLLFAQTSDGKYYLIHQWGNDLNPIRNIVNWPKRSLFHLMATVFIITSLLTLLAPNSMFVSGEEVSYLNSGRVIFFFWINLLMAAILSYAIFAFQFTFSSHNWNSRFFND